MKLTKISDIIPLIEKGETGAKISKHFEISIPSYWRYVRMLREAGYKIPPMKRGRRLPPL